MGRTPSRGTVDLVGKIRNSIVSGRYLPGQFLPSTRELGEEYGVSSETTRRGLKFLESAGLLVSKPRQGFRVLDSKRSFMQLHPVAYVTEHVPDLSNAQPVNWAISQRLHDEAAKRGWTTLGVHAGRYRTAESLGQLGSTNTWGVVLDTHDPRFLREICSTHLPVVMVNSWIEGVEIDVVIQDNYRGGFLAARHLLESGAERISWIGPIEQSCHSRERYAGAAAALQMNGKVFEKRAPLGPDHSVLEDSVRESLLAPNRPDGVLAFWKGGARIVRKVADELGLEINKDLKMVGWSVEAFYESEHLNTFAGGPVPPAIVWSAAEMAEAALDRLKQIHERNARTPIRITLPTRLKMGSETCVQKGRG